MAPGIRGEIQEIYPNIHHMSKAPPAPVLRLGPANHQNWHILMWFTQEIIPLSIHTRGSGSSNNYSTSSRKELIILSIPTFTYLGTTQHWWLSTHTYVYVYTYMYVYIYVYTYVYACICVYIYIYIYLMHLNKNNKSLYVVFQYVFPC